MTAPPRHDNPAGELAAALGKGLVAGLAGTAAMTLAQTVGMYLEDREPSDTPAEAVKKVFGLEVRDEAAQERLSNVTHWAYGTSWGAARGMAAAAGLGPVSASAVHLAAVWGAALLMLPSLDLAPPVTEWPAEQVGTDLAYHVVYAAATGAAYAWLDR